jgi:hypothetical protein
MVTVWPGFFASNRRLASNSTAFLLSSMAQWLHHCSSVARAAGAPASATPRVSSRTHDDCRIGDLLGEMGLPRRAVVYAETREWGPGVC